MSVEALQPRGPATITTRSSPPPFHQTPPVQRSSESNLWAGRTLRDLCVPLSFTDEGQWNPNGHGFSQQSAWSRDQPTIPGKQEEGDCWVSGGAVTSASPWASSYLDSPLPCVAPSECEALFTEMNGRSFQALPVRELPLAEAHTQVHGMQAALQEPKNIRPLAEQAPHSLLKSITYNCWY